MAGLQVGNLASPKVGKWAGVIMIVKELNGEMVTCISTKGNESVILHVSDVIDKGPLPGPMNVTIL